MTHILRKAIQSQRNVRHFCHFLAVGVRCVRYRDDRKCTWIDRVEGRQQVLLWTQHRSVFCWIRGEGASLQSGSSIHNDYSPAGTVCNNGIANKVYPVDLIVTPTVHGTADRIDDFHVMLPRIARSYRVIRAFLRVLRVPSRAGARERENARCVRGLPRELLIEASVTRKNFSSISILKEDFRLWCLERRVAFGAKCRRSETIWLTSSTTTEWPLGRGEAELRDGRKFYLYKNFE